MNNHNILLVANGYKRELPNLLRERMNCSIGAYVISDERPSCDHNDYKNFRDCTFCYHDDIDDYSEIPLDEALLSNLSDCQSIALKMMERYEFANNLHGFEGRERLYHRLVKYWMNYLTQNKINFCIFMTLPHGVFDYVIYSLAKFLDIKVLMFHRIPVLRDGAVSLYSISNLNHSDLNLSWRYKNHLVNKVQRGPLTERISSYYSLRHGNKGKTFTGVTNNNKKWLKIFNPLVYPRTLINRINYYRHWSRYVGFDDWILKWIYTFLRKPRKKYQWDCMSKLKTKYIFVALHFQPEASTSPMGGQFVYQDLMLEMLAKAIPSDVSIYIKPHMREGLSPELASRLTMRHNMFLLSPAMNSYKLIKGALAVATVTGTAGWEAFINRKPVLLFGNCFYQDAPGVFKIKTFSDTCEAISEIIGGRVNITDDMVSAFLYAIQDVTFPGWVDNRYSNLSELNDKENLEGITKEIITKFFKPSC